MVRKRNFSTHPFSRVPLPSKIHCSDRETPAAAKRNCIKRKITWRALLGAIILCSGYQSANQHHHRELDSQKTFSNKAHEKTESYITLQNDVPKNSAAGWESGMRATKYAIGTRQIRSSCLRDGQRLQGKNKR